MVTLTGWSPDRHQRVLSAMLHEAGLPAVSGCFAGDMFKEDAGSDPVSVAAIGAYFAPQTLEKQKAIYLAQIDAEHDALYEVLSASRLSEYALVETEAAAYRAAGCSGVAPVSVQAEAVSKGCTGATAADYILAAAAALRTRQQASRAVRLLHKEAVRAADSFDVLDAAMLNWSVALGAM